MTEEGRARDGSRTNRTRALLIQLRYGQEQKP